MAGDPHSLPTACSAAEWETRCRTGRLYRPARPLRHVRPGQPGVGARVKDDPDHYLLHQYGLFYEEITASSLLKIDRDGQPMDPGLPAPVDGAQNLAKWIFGSRPEINFFIHGHCEDVMAVGSSESGPAGRSRRRRSTSCI